MSASDNADGIVAEVFFGFLALGLCALLIAILLRRSRLKQSIRRLVEQTGAVYHSARAAAGSGQRATPPFGSFTRPADGSTTGHFDSTFGDWLTFSYRGYEVLAFQHDTRSLESAASRYVPYFIVQIRTPQIPELRIVRRENLRRDARGPQLRELSAMGETQFDAEFLVLAEDEYAARAMLPAKVLAATRDQLTRNVPVAFVDGTIGCESAGSLDAQRMLRIANQLIDVLEQIPAETWPQDTTTPFPKQAGQTGQTSDNRLEASSLRGDKSLAERLAEVVSIVGFAPLPLALLALSGLALANSTAYFLGFDGRLLLPGSGHTPSIVDSGWYGPFNDFGTALQSFAFGFVLFGLPLIATVVGLRKTYRRKRNKASALPPKTR